MNDLEKLEIFGKEIIENIRDASIEEYLAIKNGDMRSADARNIFDIYSSTDKLIQSKIDLVVMNVIDRVLHNTLWSFESSEDFAIVEKNTVAPTEDISEISDGLSGELYTEDGWIQKYSKFPSGTIS